MCEKGMALCSRTSLSRLPVKRATLVSQNHKVSTCCRPVIRACTGHGSFAATGARIALIERLARCKPGVLDRV